MHFDYEIFFGGLVNFFNKYKPQYVRDQFVLAQLNLLVKGERILDAGCGSQRYKINCQELEYYSQDFGEYTTDEKQTLGTEGVGGKSGYSYGKIDYVGNIWDVAELDCSFDVILCTEVFEHIPYPNETIREFSRLLRSGGKLILTFPSNCTRHMDPYYYYSGFSDRWAKYMLEMYGFSQIDIRPVGDYYYWMFLETYKSFRNANLIGKILTLPSVIYFFLKRPTEESINTLCLGYHVVAVKQ